jgi:chromosome segregation ATPase
MEDGDECRGMLRRSIVACAAPFATNVHTTALQNHMEVLQKHAGILNDQEKNIWLHSKALKDHRDKIRQNCNDFEKHRQQMMNLNSNVNDLDTDLIHHTNVLIQVHARQRKSEQEINKIAEQQKRIMATQSSINQNLSNLESIMKENKEKMEMLSKNSTDANMQREILKIKTAVNENAGVLQTLSNDIQKTTIIRAQNNIFPS